MKKILLKVISIMLLMALSGCGLFPDATGKAETYTAMNLQLFSDGKQLQESAEIIDKNSENIIVRKEATKVGVIASGLLKKDTVARLLQKSHNMLQKENVDLKSGKQKRIDNFFFYGIISGALLVVGAIVVWVIANMSGVVTMNGMALQLGLAGFGIMLASGVMYFYFFWGVTLLAVVVAVWLVLLVIKSYKEGCSLLEISCAGGEDNKNISVRTQKLMDQLSRRQQPVRGDNGC